MTAYHPKYGQLLTSREVADMTGFTMNQLRYFRQTPDKSPFPLLKKGNTTLYRELDILQYLEVHGVEGEEYVVPEGFEPAPLVNPTYEAKSNKDITAMSKIVTSNAWSKWTERLTQNGPMDVSTAMKFLRDETVRLLKEGTGDDLTELYPGETYDFWLRTNDPVRFWKGRTWATRSLAREIYGWNVSDQDIINVPIGEVPPSKIE